MAPSNKGNNVDSQLVEEFIRDLENTATQVSALLKEIRESEVDFASVKTELRILVENFKDLSGIIRDGDGKVSILTRMALVEKSIKEIEEWIDRHEQKEADEEKNNATIKAATEAGKWQLTAAVVTGVLALITSTIAILIDVFVK